MQQFKNDIKKLGYELNINDKDHPYVKIPQELNQEKKEKIIDLAKEYCYDISKDSRLYILAELDFMSEEDILSELKKNLLSEYHMQLTIDDNRLANTSEKDFRHIKKVVEEKYSFILEAKQDNNILIKVKVANDKKRSNSKDINKLRDFKTATDIKGKSNFDITKSVLTITTNNEAEYDNHISRVKELYPSAILEDRPYQPTFFLKFKNYG